MFTAQLKNLFFKKNVSDLDSLLEDQASTYAVMRYAHDIPTSKFDKAIAYLVEHVDEVTDKRLARFVDEYIKATGVGLQEFTDEYDYSLDIVINKEEPFGECEFMLTEDDD